MVHRMFFNNSLVVVYFYAFRPATSLRRSRVLIYARRRIKPSSSSKLTQRRISTYSIAISTRTIFLLVTFRNFHFTFASYNNNIIIVIYYTHNDRYPPGSGAVGALRKVLHTFLTTLFFPLLEIKFFLESVTRTPLDKLTPMYTVACIVYTVYNLLYYKHCALAYTTHGHEQFENVFFSSLRVLLKTRTGERSKPSTPSFFRESDSIYKKKKKRFCFVVLV